MNSRQPHRVIKLYSFDIFDTLITRTTGRPDGIFYFMQDALLKDSHTTVSSFVKENFYDIRRQTEANLRNFLNVQEILLDDIYRLIGINNQLSNAQINYLKGLEINTEIKNSIGIQVNIDQVKTLIQNNKKVILISDMYHTSATIIKILCGIDSIFQNIPIYVSSEYLKTKSTGELYKLIYEREKVEYPEWMHIGDNFVSDVSVPKSLGIYSVQYISETLKPYEKRIINSNSAYIQASIGAAKNARLFDCKHNLKMEFGASFGGPLFFPYVKWVLQESIKKNIKHLYFVARDGYTLKKIADIIIKHEKYDLKTHYIYGSRLTWRIPVDNDLSCLFYYNFNSFQDIANALHISIKELKSYFPDLKKNVKNFNKIEIRKFLESNNDFISFINEKHRREISLLIQYLKQEINFSSDNFAFVEFTGTGFTQECLNNIINTFHQQPLKTFFMHLGNDPFSIKSNIYAFMPDSKGYNYLEPLLRAPDGQTIGYADQQEEGGRISPFFIESETKAMENYHYNDFTAGVEAYTKRLMQSLNLLNLSSIQHLQFKEYMDYIFSSPDKELADLIGSIPFSPNVYNFKNEFVPKVSLIDIIRKITKTYHTNFKAISIARSNRIIKFLYYILRYAKGDIN
jgi:HAD superfamily hydrolase (TIGR01549 family)